MKYLIYYDLQHQFYRVASIHSIDNETVKPIMITCNATVANLTRIKLNKKRA